MIQPQIHPHPRLELEQPTIQFCCQVGKDFVQPYQICKTVNMQKTSDRMFMHVDVFVMVVISIKRLKYGGTQFVMSVSALTCIRLNQALYQAPG